MSGAGPDAPRAGRGCLFWAALLTTVLAIGPMLSAFLASAIADGAGCVLNEAGAHPCVVGGVDIGEWLAVAFLLAWLTIATIWLVPVAAILWIVWLIGRRRRTGA